MRLLIPVILVLTFAGFAGSTEAADTSYLYKASFIQAAPGKILDLIELYKSRQAAYKTIGDEAPMWCRHSQGDKWDLLMLFPMGDYVDYYQSARISRRRAAESAQFLEKLKEYIAWQEDIFVHGPPLDETRRAFGRAGFFHLEIFQALPGKHSELLKEREMENAYQKLLKRPENLIFVRDQGAGWDIFTIGMYRDIKHYAESADFTEKDQEAAAKASGFGAANKIGPYLRTLISAHHDTLAIAIK
ncbi:MAG: hypothetical protein DMF61_19355 [Blastocatellia bacterium AA13]|nr:MAG: hypothetical protein DMF61_19355 [Blastocatellia bacterium AA13]